MAKQILVVLTSHNKMGDTGKPTGWYLPEFAHAYDEFKAAGYDVIVASPAGGEAPLDPASIEMFKSDAPSIAFLNNNKDLWSTTKKLSDFLGKTADFAALYFPGGHGPMFDLATDPQSHQLVNEFIAAGKVVGAVCHGPAALANVVLPSTGEPLLKGKSVTGFSNAEEDQVGLTPAMPFMLEDRLNEVSGGKYVKAADPWGEKVVVDGLVVTGQNPASTAGVGKAMVKAIGA